MSNTPEHDKLLAAKENSQIIGEFLEWAESHGYQLSKEVSVEVVDWRGTESTETDYVPVSINEVLLKYFDIDPAKIDDEQKATLAEIRAASVCQRSVES